MTKPNVEELAAAGGQVSGEAAPASGSASQPDRSLPPARGSGGRARRPPEPSAGRRRGTHYPPGSLPVLAVKSCFPPGSPACSCCNDEPTIKLMCDWKAEMNLRTPRRPCGITIYAAHNKRGQRNERKCFATGPASATGEGGRGTCATSPGAIRKSKVPCSLPSGHLTCSCAQAKQSLRTPCLLLRQ